MRRKSIVVFLMAVFGALLLGAPAWSQTYPARFIRVIVPFAPAGTPRPIITRLNAELRKVMARSDAEEQLVLQGYESHTSTPEELGAYVRSETVKWAKVIQEARIPRQGQGK